MDSRRHEWTIKESQVCTNVESVESSIKQNTVGDGMNGMSVEFHQNTNVTIAISNQNICITQSEFPFLPFDLTSKCLSTWKAFLIT